MSSFASQSSSLPKPRSVVSRSQALVWGAATGFVLLLMGMIVGAPLAMSGGHEGIGLAIYRGFSPLCHQISDRSFHIEGHAFAVCARCTGIYAGFAAVVVFYPLLKSLRQTETPRRVWLFLAAVPIFVDWSLGFTGIWANTHLSRLLTGALLGSVCALFVVPGLLDLPTVNWRRFFMNNPSESSRKLASTLPISNDGSAPSDFGSPASRI